MRQNNTIFNAIHTAQSLLNKLIHDYQTHKKLNDSDRNKFHMYLSFINNPEKIKETHSRALELFAARNPDRMQQTIKKARANYQQRHRVTTTPTPQARQSWSHQDIQRLKKRFVELKDIHPTAPNNKLFAIIAQEEGRSKNSIQILFSRKILNQ